MTTTDQRPVPHLADAFHDLHDLPHPVERLVAPVARRAVEIIRDRRPVTSLSRVITPEVAEHLARRAALTRRLRAATGCAPSRPLEVTGVRVCVVNERTVETSCVLREPDRARFLAMRWELRRSGWRVTVLEIG